MKLEYKIIENTWLPGMDHGWGNGYVLLPKDHKYYGVEYDKIDVDVHGGLTYSDQEGDYWVVGFDTAHYADTQDNWPKELVLMETVRLKVQLERFRAKRIKTYEKF